MTIKRNCVPIATIALLCVSVSGCAHKMIVRQTAVQLRVAVVEDERLVDANIKSQGEFYDAQRAEIEKARTKNIEFTVEDFRRMRSARAATTMSLDHETEARLANLMDYLIGTHDQEYELWQKLYGGDQQAREDLLSRIAKLQRQKKVLEGVKDGLNQLALAPSSKKQAQALLEFSQQTYEAFKKTSH